MARVDIDDLTVRFGGVTAVDGLSLTLHDGEFIVLLGPSGCGKTTTLRCIAGLQKSTSGEIRFNGKAVTELPPAERNIGMVFQFVSLYPHLTVRQNIAFPIACARRRRDRRSPRKSIGSSRCSPSATSSTDSSSVCRPGRARRSRSHALSCVSRTCCCSTSLYLGWRSNIARRCAGSCASSRRSSA